MQTGRLRKPHHQTLLHDEADHCLVLVVGAMRSSSRKDRPLVCSGPVEDCR
jgi:hypothetical protein